MAARNTPASDAPDEAVAEPSTETGEWFIATAPLFIEGGVRAGNPGDRVEKATVENNGWQDLVEPAPKA